MNLGFSTASLAGCSLDEACRIGHDLGFAAAEFLAFDGFRHSQGPLAGFYFDRMTPAEKDHLRALAEGFGHVSLHAQFYEMAPLSPSPGLREAAWHELVVTLEAAQFLGAATVTTHASPKASHTLEQSWDDLVAHYRRLGDAAAERGCSVTIETIYPSALDDFARLIHDIAHPAIGANVDVGHLTGLVPRELIGTPAAADYYNDLLEQHLRSLGPKLFHFHLHDVRAEDLRDHRACGRGLIDYTRLVRVARELQYAGWFVYELEEPDLIEALKQSRDTLLAAGQAVC